MTEEEEQKLLQRLDKLEQDNSELRGLLTKQVEPDDEPEEPEPEEPEPEEPEPEEPEQEEPKPEEPKPEEPKPEEPEPEEPEPDDQFDKGNVQNKDKKSKSGWWLF